MIGGIHTHIYERKEKIKNQKSKSVAIEQSTGSIMICSKVLFILLGILFQTPPPPTLVCTIHTSTNTLHLENSSGDRYLLVHGWRVGWHWVT